MREFSKEYLSILTNELAGLNLTRVLDPEEFYLKQIYDSYLPLEKSRALLESIEETSLLVDIGFGGGFPILPLAKKLPHISFLGLEARNKKVEAVSLIADKLELKNVKLYHHRLDDILFDKPAVITLKAVGKITEFLKMINSSVEVYCFFYKGPKVEELESIGAPNGWKLMEDISFEVEGTEGRRLLSYKSIVPRRTKLSKTNSKKNSLVRLSELN